MSKNKSQKYKIVLKTAPSKHDYTQEEIDQKIDKAINIILDDLMLNERLNLEDCAKLNTRKKETK